MSKKNLILLANYFCVNEDWLATGEGDKDAPGVVRDTLIHDNALRFRYIQIAQALYGNDNNNKINEDIDVSIEVMSTYTDIPQERIWGIVYDNQFPSYTEIQNLLKADQRIDANWLFLGVGSMFRTGMSQKDTERITTLVDTISTLQDTINLKSEIIIALNERIKQLENQLGK